MFIGHVGSLSASWIDDNKPPTTRTHHLGFVAKIRHSPEASIGNHWICAQHQQKVSTLDVRYRNRKEVAEHQAARKMLGHLVQGRRGKNILRSQGATQARRVKQQREFVDDGISQRQSNRIRSMFGDDWRQAALNLGESLIPCGFLKASVAFNQRLAEAIRIFMQVLKSHAFGTEIAMAEDIGGVPANAFYAAFGHSNFKATTCFTKRADPMVNGFISCFDHRAPP